MHSQVKLREMKPELLSYELKEALGMPDGAPPPCLIKYAEIWSPSLYPHLKIPGLNAPIPTGASFGNHVGGCGKPLFKKFFEEEPVDKTKHWGDLERDEEEGKDLEDGVESVDSLSSTPTGNEKPDVIDLHKQQRKEPERPLYQVSTMADTFFND
ncbi:putative PSP, proline-rich [Rosa chinensis]|uniref:Putative PSP, proline-rich n=1 Tax=Rosa chinensis TaxID=74649 RepID=A0A2P6Q3R5_ROSCH|nr:putative PSP, proline-rich [Rosa chinensis]